MMQTLNKMKEKLEKESTEHKNVKQQVAELTGQLHELSTVRRPLPSTEIWGWVEMPPPRREAVPCLCTSALSSPFLLLKRQ